MSHDHKDLYESVTQGLLRPVGPIDHAMQRIRQGWDLFQTYLDTDTPPPLTDADTVLRDDAAWTQAAQAFSQAKQDADQADEAVTKAREALWRWRGIPRSKATGCQ